MDGGVNVNLVSGGATENGGGTAPSLGSYNGLVIYQDPSDSSAMSYDRGIQLLYQRRHYRPRILSYDRWRKRRYHIRGESLLSR